MTSITSLTQNSGLAREASDSKKSPLLDLGTTEKFTDYLKPSDPDRKPQSKTSAADTTSDRNVAKDSKQPVDKAAKKNPLREPDSSATDLKTPPRSEEAKVSPTEKPATEDLRPADTADESAGVATDEVAAIKEDENSSEQDLTASIENLVAQLLATPVCDCPIPVDVAKLVEQQGLEATGEVADITEIATSLKQLVQVVDATTSQPALSLEELPVVQQTTEDEFDVRPIIATEAELETVTELVTATEESSDSVELSEALSNKSIQLEQFVQAQALNEPSAPHQGKIDLSSLPAAAQVEVDPEVESHDEAAQTSQEALKFASELSDPLKQDSLQVSETFGELRPEEDSSSDEAIDEVLDQSTAVSSDSLKSATAFSSSENPMLKENSVSTAGPHHTHSHSNTHPTLHPADHQRFLTRASRAFELANARGGEIRIRLHPPELGSLRVEMKLEQGQMVAKVETESTAAKNLLVENLPQLKERLQELGVTIESFDVNVAQRDSRQDQQDAQEQAKRNRAVWNNQLPEAPSELEASTPRLPWQRSEGLNIVI